MIFCFWGTFFAYCWKQLLLTIGKLSTLNSQLQSFYSPTDSELTWFQETRLACNFAVCVLLFFFVSLCCVKETVFELKDNARIIIWTVNILCCFVPEWRNKAFSVWHHKVEQELLLFFFWTHLNYKLYWSYKFQLVKLILYFFCMWLEQIFELHSCSVSWVMSNQFRLWHERLDLLNLLRLLFFLLQCSFFSLFHVTICSLRRWLTFFAASKIKFVLSWD